VVGEASRMTQSEFEKALKVLVEQRMLAVREEVVAAVSQAMSRSQPTQGSRATRKKRSRRLRASEVEELAGLLLAEIEKQPGEGMASFAAALGRSSAALRSPMKHLKERKQVRSIGRRHQMKYFPTA